MFYSPVRLCVSVLAHQSNSKRRRRVFAIPMLQDGLLGRHCGPSHTGRQLQCSSTCLALPVSAAYSTGAHRHNNGIQTDSQTGRTLTRQASKRRPSSRRGFFESVLREPVRRNRVYPLQRNYTLHVAIVQSIGTVWCRTGLESTDIR